MAYKLVDMADGTVLGTISFDPFRLKPSRAGKEADVAAAFEGIEEAPVMDTAAAPKEGTAAERKADADSGVVKRRVQVVLHDRGWAAMDGGT